MAQQDNGFLYVASQDYIFYQAALYSIESLKDYYPEARVCLVTHENWVCPRARVLVDDLITENVPNHHRAKLWALNKTPYEITAYMDCDTEVIHEDIQYIFDEIGDEDMAFTLIRPYAVKVTEIPAGTFTLHCGLFLYRNRPHVFDLLWDWWLAFYRFNDQGEWPFDPERYPPEMRKWDTFVFWWLMNETPHKDKISYSIMDVRFNFIHTYRESELTKPMVVWHEPVPGNA